MPLEAIYLDVFSNHRDQDFELDEAKFKNYEALEEAINPANIKIIAYVDSGISVENTKNTFYVEGNKAGTFIKTSMDYKDKEKYSGNLVNMKYHKKVVYYDWTNEKCQDLWDIGLNQLAESAFFDGLWTTMNEPYGHHAGEYNPDTKEEKPDKPVFPEEPEEPVKPVDPKEPDVPEEPK